MLPHCCFILPSTGLWKHAFPARTDAPSFGIGVVSAEAAWGVEVDPLLIRALNGGEMGHVCEGEQKNAESLPLKLIDLFIFVSSFFRGRQMKGLSELLQAFQKSPQKLFLIQKSTVSPPTLSLVGCFCQPEKSPILTSWKGEYTTYGSGVERASVSKSIPHPCLNIGTWTVERLNGLITRCCSST